MIDKNNQLQEMVLDTGGRCWYPNKRVQQVHTADEWSRRDRALKSAAPKEQCHRQQGLDRDENLESTAVRRRGNRQGRDFCRESLRLSIQRRNKDLLRPVFYIVIVTQK